MSKLNAKVHRLSLCFATLLDSTLSANLFEVVGQLTYLDLSCTNISTLAYIGSLPNLRTLILQHCSELKSVDDLPRWPALTHLDFQRSPAVCHNLHILLKVPNLAVLDLGKCKLFDSDMHPFPSSLRHLDLSFASVTDVGLQHLGTLQSLTYLNLSHVEFITHVQALHDLTKLRTLHLDWCASLVDITGLSRLHQLQSLNLHQCHSLTDFEALSALYSLHSLMLGYTRIKDLSPLSTMFKLQRLVLLGCFQILCLSPVADLPLEYLDLTGCQPNLRNLSHTPALRPITNLSNIFSLVQPL
jgi:Leucine-rich repeat (LRR) protein